MRKLIIALAIVVAVVLAADFGTRAYAQAQIADQLRSAGFPVRPSVSIGGFPFLTQVAARDLHQITISATDVPAGPVSITRIDAVLINVRPNASFTGATVGRLRGQAFISFAALSQALVSQAGGLGGALTGGGGLALAPVGTDEIRASLNLIVATASATWRVSLDGDRSLRASLVSSSGLPASLLGPAANIAIPLTTLPLGLRLSGVTVGPTGITGRLDGSNLTFGH